MKSSLKILLFFICLSANFSCQKKSLDLKLIETACVDLKIYNATYQIISDPSCPDSNITSGKYKISFQYENHRECLKKIVIDPVFYRLDQTKISAASFTNLLYDTSASVSITSNTVTFIFNCQFANRADADALNNIFFTIHTENSLGDESKDVLLRINAECSLNDPSKTSVFARDTVTSEKISVRLWDDKAEDGDIVSVALNGVWVMQNYTLKNAGETFDFCCLNSGANNDFVVLAMNQGTSGPNTCAITINSGKQIDLSPNLLTGQKVSIYFKP